MKALEKQWLELNQETDIELEPKSLVEPVLIDIAQTVIVYFIDLDNSVSPFGLDIGMTREDAASKLLHNLEPFYLDWKNHGY